MKRMQIMKQLTAKGPLSMESIPGVPLVELLGDHRLLIENHRGIVGYGDNEIQIHLQYGTLSIAGRGLCIAYMSKSRLIIHGEIKSISIYRG